MADRSALLKSIEKGAKLKKVKEVNDRSAPEIEKAANETSASTNGPPRMNVMPNVAIPSAAGGLFAGGFPKLRPTKSANQREKSEVVVEPPALPSRPRPPSNSSSPKVSTNSAQSVVRKPPPPVPPRLATTPTKAKPSGTTQSTQTGNMKKFENVAHEAGNFLSQVKLRPTGVLKSPHMPNKPEFQKLTKSEPPKVIESKPTKTFEKVQKQTKEPSKIAASFEKREKELIDLPPVPKNFSGKPKEYPSGAKKGLFINHNLYINKKVDEMAQLEKELKEAAIREDFELCVELKKKISLLKLC